MHERAQRQAQDDHNYSSYGHAIAPLLRRLARLFGNLLGEHPHDSTTKEKEVGGGHFRLITHPWLSEPHKHTRQKKEDEFTHVSSEREKKKKYPFLAVADGLACGLAESEEASLEEED